MERYPPRYRCYKVRMDTYSITVKHIQTLAYACHHMQGLTEICTSFYTSCPSDCRGMWVSGMPASFFFFFFSHVLPRLCATSPQHHVSIATSVFSPPSIAHVPSSVRASVRV
ncbi:uncharacterized [Tachysurus ichikawai]